jgi:hypothetical protein
MPEEELLENLARSRGCFISSLKDGSTMDATLRALLEIDPGRYGMPEWNYCFSYLFGREFSFHTQEEVQEFLHERVSAAGGPGPVGPAP